MKITIILIASILFSRTLAQTPESNSDWQIYIGYRSMPVPGCYCYFEPTEFDVKLRSNLPFTGVAFKSKSGFVFMAEGGYYKRTYVNTQLISDNPPHAYYNQSEELFRGLYANATVGYSIGKNRLKLSPIIGIDYHIEESYRKKYVTAYYANIPYATTYYPTIEPSNRWETENFYSRKLKTAAFLVGIRLSYEITKRIGVMAGSELLFWPAEYSTSGNNNEKKLGSYRIALQYHF